MESGTLAIPRRLLLTPVQTVCLTRAPESSTAHGVLNLGEALFDALSPGSFTGSASGTVLAVNAPGSFGGNFIDVQAAGSSMLSISSTGALTSASTVQGTALSPAGLTGATAASRYAGATASGAPASGTFNTGDYVIDQSGSLRVCTAGGSPGTWTTAGGVSSGLQKISDSTSGSAFASVTFSSIPSTYRHLFLVIEGRGDTAASSTNIQMQFNGDTGSTYQHYMVSWHGASPAATVTATGASPATSMIVGTLVAASATASYASKYEVVITSYADTTFFHPVTSNGGFLQGTGTTNSFVNDVAGLWNSTAAITSIKIFLAAGNFVANSVLTLYGLP